MRWPVHKCRANVDTLFFSPRKTLAKWIFEPIRLLHPKRFCWLVRSPKKESILRLFLKGSIFSLEHFDMLSLFGAETKFEQSDSPGFRLIAVASRDAWR